jgi:hypothetical protein
MTLSRRTAITAALLSLAAIPAAGSAAGWNLPAFTPVVPCTFGDCSDTQMPPDVATAPDGTTTMVWISRATGSSTTWQIKASTRAPGADGFGEPVNVVAALDLPGVVPSRVEMFWRPQIAFEGDGTATVVWKDEGINDAPIGIATRAPGASNFVVGPSIGSTGYAPTIAASADATTILWDTGTAVQAATRPAGATTFNTPDTLASKSLPDQPTAIAMAPDGTTTALWQKGANMEAKTRPAGSAVWGELITGTDVSPGSMSAAAGSDGTMAIAWADTSNNVNVRIRAQGDNAYGPVKVLGMTGSRPDLAVSPDGTVSVVWIAYGPAPNYVATVVSSELAPGATTFSSPVELSPTAYTSFGEPSPQAAVSQNGDLTAAWFDTRSSGVIVARTRANGAAAGAYGPAVELSAPIDAIERVGVPALAGGGPGGLVTATWAFATKSKIGVSWTLPGTYTLTAANAGAGSGTITSAPAGIDCGATCTAPFDAASSVTLTATPATGSTFAGWSGAGCSGTSTCVVTMSAAQSVTATFDVTSASPTDTDSNSRPGPTPAPGPSFGVTIPSALAREGLRASANGTVALPLACPSGIPGGCDASGVLSTTLPGSVQAQRGKREQASRTRVLARFRGVEIATGKTRLYTVRLAPATYTALRRAGVRRVPATLRIVNRTDSGKPAVTRQRVWLRIAPLALPVTG